MNFLETITKEIIENEPLPISDLLKNSLYYPACGLDGGVIRHCSKYIQSFIYCDYAIGKTAFLREMDRIYGYDIIAHRPVRREELVPVGWNPVLPPCFDMERYYSYREFFKKPFAYWVIYQRRAEFDDRHGGKRLSLLYIGGEGVATYQALYQSNKRTAKYLAIIQPGTAFGLNWTDFCSKDSPLFWTVIRNEFGVPDTIFLGGGGGGYTKLDWDGYKLTETIRPYYIYRDAYYDEPHGTVTVWGK